MQRASTCLTPEQRAEVERAIADAERSTSAEIVVVLATRSGRYDRAEDIVGVLLGLVAVSIAWLVWQRPVVEAGEWGTSGSLAFGLLPLLAMFVIWTIAGAALATWFPALARPFVSRAHLEAEVRRRGVEAFHLLRVYHTSDRTGLLIFVSLVERMAWVVGDDVIKAKVPESTWTEACSAVTAAFRACRPAEGFVKAVSLCGAALAAHFPPVPGQPTDELANTVHVMD